MHEVEATYRQAQMEYTAAVSRYCEAKGNPSLALSTVLSAGRLVNVASDALADAVVALVRAGK
jgi:hypothetical protein